MGYVELACAISFLSLSLCLKRIDLGKAYAVWSAIGTILTVLTGVFLWHESINFKGIIGIAIIIIGVAILNLVLQIKNNKKSWY